MPVLNVIDASGAPAVINTLPPLAADGGTPSHVTNVVAISAPGAGLGTDASSTPPAALTLLKSGVVAHAGQLYVQNQSGNTIQLILNPGAGQTVIVIDPGVGPNRQGGDWSAAQNMPWFLGSFSINGPAGAQAACNFN